MNAIEVNHISKSYGAVKALDDVSFTVGKGEVFGLIGPDGAGKTSLYRILCSLLLPEKGSATVDGFDVVGLKRPPWWKFGVAGRTLTVCARRKTWRRRSAPIVGEAMPVSSAMLSPRERKGGLR